MPMQTWKLYNVEAMDFNLFFRVDNTANLYDSMSLSSKPDFKMLWQVGYPFLATPSLLLGRVGKLPHAVLIVFLCSAAPSR